MLHHNLLFMFFNIFQLLCNVLSWSSRNNKPLKMPSDSISEGLIFQNFLGGLPRMLYMPDCVYTLHTITMLTVTKLCPPLFRILDQPLNYPRKNLLTALTHSAWFSNGRKLMFAYIT